MGMSVNAGGGVKAEPNVVPMIDVMLVLLIIFMVVTPAISTGFTAEPPSASTSRRILRPTRTRSSASTSSGTTS
jgi:biopolymer transport protein ExbD